MGYFDNAKFEELKGKTLTEVKVSEDGDEVTFTTNDGSEYRMYHSQDCCESVGIEDVVGDWEDIVGSPILLAEEVTSDTQPAPEGRYADDCALWTFYKLATIKGTVNIRWFGTSNGYYSVSVDFNRTVEPNTE